MYDHELSVEGVTSLSGKQFLKVTYRGGSACLPHNLFAGTCQAAVSRLAEHGVVISGSKAAEKVATAARNVRKFSKEPLADGIGWNGLHFGLPDGTVFSPNDDAAKAIYPKLPEKCRVRGSFKGWKSQVAKPLTGQSIPMFSVMFAFMPPLLRLSALSGNPGFEIVGPPGIGKSTAQLLGASVLGGTEAEAEPYGITFDITLNALEPQMAIHADLPIFVEEAALFFADESPAKRAATFKALAFRMNAGRDKDRLNAPAGPAHRFGFISSSNELLVAMVGETTDVAKATGDRLSTLAVTEDRPYGVFDSLPTTFDSTTAFASAIRRAAAENHGHAIRRYLQALVNARATDEAGLKTYITGRIAKFREKAGIDLNDGSAVRVADAFGLVFAAGSLAQLYGVLPKGWKCGPAALRCHRDHLRRISPQLTFEQRLIKAGSAPGVVNIVRGRKPKKALLAKTDVFVRERAAGRELIIRAAAIKKVFCDWDVIRRRPIVQATMVRDGKHLTTKRTLRTGDKPVIAYCFRFPSTSPESDAQTI